MGFFVYYQQFQFDQFELDVVTGEVRPRVLQDANYKNIKIAIRGQNQKNQNNFNLY